MNSAQAPSGHLEDTSEAMLHFFGVGLYDEILQLQEKLRLLRASNEIPDTWLVGEHPAVITQGVRGVDEDLRMDSGAGGIPIYHIDRGGMTTLHSPGQLIIYPIVKVKGGSLAAGRLARELLRTVQVWLRDEFGVEAAPLPRQPGLFVEGKKLLNIGISVRGGVSMHGVAMNLCNDLSLWRWIVACGEPTTRPVSLSDLIGRRIEPADQTESIERWLKKTWQYGRVVRDIPARTA